MHRLKKTIIDSLYKINAILNVFSCRLINIRIKKKLQKNKKINVLFICERPSVWESLKTVYEKMINDNSLNVNIIAIPCKKQQSLSTSNTIVYDSEGSEEFWKNCNCINGYNYKKNKWFNPLKLKPDYIFFQRPYDFIRYRTYRSYYLSKFAKVCYVAYHGVLSFNDIYMVSLPRYFMSNVSFFFAQSKKDSEFVKNVFKNYENRIVSIINSGFPRFYGMSKYKNNSSEIWNKNKLFRILWNTRWSTNEGNCNFFKYKNNFYEYCRNNKDIDFVYRPHPQAFQEWDATGEFSKRDQDVLREQYRSVNNMHIDESNSYYDLMYSSDILISDYSSIILDYLITGKPIIYCECENCKMIGNMDHIISALYVVHNWKELEEMIEKLKAGDDPLEINRNKIKTNYVVTNRDPAEEINNIIHEDIEK